MTHRGTNGHLFVRRVILWLYGPAGAGKSAILQTIAERCFEHNVLLASFFFGRSDPTRNTFKPLIATITYQIAVSIPEIKPVVENIIERDPLIFTKSIATQLQSLIIEPLRDLATSGFFNDPNNCARLILIDGLDECNDPRMQSVILRALANALREQKLPLIFLVASRPEQHITLTFNLPPLAGLWRSLVLDDSFTADNDIRLFLVDTFQEIKTTHPLRDLIPEAWPEPSDIEELVFKSSGQFIYSSIVVDYVSVSVDRPPRRLEIILGLHSTRHDIPFSELDTLYKHILGSCPHPNIVLSILGLFLSGLPSPLSLAQIEMHLDMEPGDAEIALSPLTSILDIQKDTFVVPGTYIKLRHASFSDFLVDISRSGPFHINTVSVEERLISEGISKLMNPYSIIGHSQPWWRILAVLADSFLLHQHDVPLNKTVENALKEFSFPQFWSIWSTGPHSAAQGSRVYLPSRFLIFLSGNKSYNKSNDHFYPLPPGFSTIYETHLSSFEHIFRSEIQKYYQDARLTSLVVISVVVLNKYLSHVLPLRAAPLSTLLQLTKESEKLDSDSLSLMFTYGQDLLVTHYRYLFDGPKKSPELCPDGDKHAQVALRVLEYLCDHPPVPIPYRKRQTSKTFSYRTGAFVLANGLSRFLPSYGIVRRLQLTNSRFLRKRREEKHQHGMALSIPDTSQPSGYQYSSIYQACDLGLSLLPHILERSSISPELVDFIQKWGKDIVFMPKLTRKVICAMHEYLGKTDEDVDMVQLGTKFSAMVIE